MKAEQFSKDSQEFLRLLAKHEVRYVLIGGIAVIYHGYARLTGDIDFLFDRSRENVLRLWSALLEFWGGNVPALTSADELLEPNIVVQFGRPPNRIDLIGEFSSVQFEEAWQSRIAEQITVDGQTVPVWIVGLGALRRSKAEAGRPKDLDDLEHLPR